MAVCSEPQQRETRQEKGVLAFLPFSFLESRWELEAASSRCELRALLGWVLFDSHLSLRDSRGGPGVCVCVCVRMGVI